MLRRLNPELKLFLGAYLLYNIGRWVTAGDIGPATENARWIVDLEDTLGVGVERSVQDGLAGGVSMWVLSHIYLAAQLVVVPSVLVFLYRKARPIYRKLRDTVLATWLISIPVYAAFPVAPPRLAGLGFTDSVSAHGAVSMTGRSSVFYNELAAVPSLHCGFAVAVGIALAAAANRPLAKALALLWGPLVCLTVVATGNHYVFDIAAGLAAALAGYAVGALLRRPRRTPAPAVRGALIARSEAA
jgi:membrane-associated phospholipid phosphatase